MKIWDDKKKSVHVPEINDYLKSVPNCEKYDYTDYLSGSEPYIVISYTKMLSIKSPL